MSPNPFNPSFTPYAVAGDSSPEFPFKADAWLYQTGDFWTACHGEDEAAWFEDETHDPENDPTPSWPNPRSYPINECPPFGTLYFRGANGVEHEVPVSEVRS